MLSTLICLHFLLVSLVGYRKACLSLWFPVVTGLCAAQGLFTLRIFVIGRLSESLVITLVSIGLWIVWYVYISYCSTIDRLSFYQEGYLSLWFPLVSACELSTVICLHFLLVPFGGLTSYKEACLSLWLLLVSVLLAVHRGLFTLPIGASWWTNIL